MKTILSLNGYFNYGNRLQLFAMSKVIEKFDNVNIYWPKTLGRRFKEFLKYNTPLALKFNKEAKLRKFTNMYIPQNTGSKKIDFVVVGSDQVWNPDYFENAKYLLDPPFGDIRISYAASVGSECLTDVHKSMFSRALSKFDSISVREKSAKELLQPLTNKKIEVVLDPTLLLDKIEYEKLERKPKNVADGEKYVLCYILGDTDHQLAVEKFARENGYRIIKFSDKNGSRYSVEEFLYLIHHAKLVCTDSFHACVFSFIFDRPFVAFRRTGEASYMYSRLQNFIDLFKIKGSEYNGFEITERNLRCSYIEGKKILKKEKEKSLAFLEKALEDKRGTTLGGKKVNLDKSMVEIAAMLQKNNRISFRKFVKAILRYKRYKRDVAFWPNAMAIYAFSFDKKYFKYIEKQIKDWEKKGFVITEYDDILMAYVLIEKTKLLSCSQKDILMGNVRRALSEFYGKSIPYRKQDPQSIYIDLLGMVPPLLIADGVRRNDIDYINWGIMQFEDFIKMATDKKTGLPYHAFNLNDGEKLGVIGWGRALGWIMVGLAESIMVLSDKYSMERKKLLGMYKKYLDNITLYQRADGGVSWQLQAINGPLDSSATAMILQSMYMVHPYIGKKYDQIMRKMMSCLDNCYVDGKIMNCSAECGGAGIYPQVYGSYIWSVVPYVICKIFEGEYDVEK